MANPLYRAPFRPADVSGPHPCSMCRRPVNQTFAPAEIAVAYTDGARWLCMACYCEHKDDYEWPSSED